MENKKHINLFKEKNSSSKFIIPLMRKNKSMNLIFEKNTNLLPLTDKNLIKITSINFMKKKNITENVSKIKCFSSDKNFYKRNSSQSNLRTTSSNYSSFHSQILKSRKKSLDINEKNAQKNIKNKLLFHNKILREAIFKKDGKFYSNKKINTIHCPKTEITDEQLRLSQIKTRSPNFKLFKYKKIKIKDNFSLNIFLLPKMEKCNIFNLK